MKRRAFLKLAGASIITPSLLGIASEKKIKICPKGIDYRIVSKAIMPAIKRVFYERGWELQCKENPEDSFWSELPDLYRWRKKEGDDWKYVMAVDEDSDDGREMLHKFNEEMGKSRIQARFIFRILAATADL